VSQSILNLPAQKFDYSLWHHVFKLLRLRVVILFNTFRRAKLRRKIGTIILGLVFFSFAAFLFWASWALLGFLRSPLLQQYIDPAPLIDAIPTLVVSLAFFIIMLTNFGVLLQALYLAGDMDFLMSAPIPIRAVFIAKLLQGILPNFALICLFTLPLLFGLGLSSGYYFPFFVLVILELSLLSLAAAGITSLLVMAIVRLVPPRRIAEVLGFLAAIISVTLGQSGQFTRFVRLDANQATSTLQSLTRVNTLWSPLAWAGEAMQAVGQGNWLLGGGLAVLSLGLFAGVFYLTLGLAQRLYYTGWARMQGSERRKKAQRRRVTEAPAATRTRGIRILPGAVQGLVVKDFLLLRRDLRNVSQLITPLILGLIFLVTRHPSGAPAGVAELSRFGLANIDPYVNVLFALFVGWMLMINLALSAFSREGKQYWIIKAAPLRTGMLLVGKFIVAYLPTAILAWLFLLIAYLIRPVSPLDLIYGLVVVSLSIGGLAGVTLAFGVTGARMDWEDPRQMGARGVTGCITTVVSMVYVAISAALFFLPPVLLQLFASSLNVLIGQGIGLLLGAVFSLACAVIVPRLVASRVPRLGEAD
jgi:ABC-2 type transport system permease protein